ncbi:hypothetical protein [Synechococcus sp. MIT S9504]|uniref:hypothetical protein n=1 Tax=Synechococcus sp. MIT S9504 TaxID=1801628 RepID=UPI0007BC4C5A|nr:hypothetical protein [Synechococcus sp. MIT S9504]KZR86677.1 hypothetical protein MITS9504_01281 [Synechococcus sp. MIT S9504]
MTDPTFQNDTLTSAAITAVGIGVAAFFGAPSFIVAGGCLFLAHVLWRSKVPKGTTNVEYIPNPQRQQKQSTSVPIPKSLPPNVRF